MTDPRTAEYPEAVEALARRLCMQDRGNPNGLVQLGLPVIYGRGENGVFGIGDPKLAFPLWKVYAPAAQAALELARGYMETHATEAAE